MEELLAEFNLSREKWFWIVTDVVFISGWPSKIFQKPHLGHKKTASKVKNPQIVKLLYLSFENILNDKKTFKFYISGHLLSILTGFYWKLAFCRILDKTNRNWLSLESRISLCPQPVSFVHPSIEQKLVRRFARQMRLKLEYRGICWPICTFQEDSLWKFVSIFPQPRELRTPPLLFPSESHWLV